ncbi:fluoride efflux transporter CrcB [Amycolatopsis regifaucium]|uniref:Fluoride-specific ion channel FluC n=1 Tax=Amycolatopsis regifaucium TaxID=546365 RepID=A0A154M7P7_9PSEU|nr:fluoride efflux transporter CrcB [Amycolatopsis regifaucium]KZB80651.1 chromosome condensation protein CrcB [Amycolatopsis regifaucium]OKA03113.1 chromosome condensation protein CrcB [Amycolatopsis regifaucium]SFH01746.1 CrcB protein [Amycolatopsis regifaucium]
MADPASVPRPRWDVLVAIGAGGALGSLTRYGLSVALPHSRGQFALSTFAINVSGCLLIGVLMALLTATAAPRRLLRPFLGVGILGGYTTFSTYATETLDLVTTGHPFTGLAYALGTVAAALIAVYAGHAITRAVVK